MKLMKGITIMYDLLDSLELTRLAVLEKFGAPHDLLAIVDHRHCEWFRRNDDLFIKEHNLRYSVDKAYNYNDHLWLFQCKQVGVICTVSDD